MQLPSVNQAKESKRSSLVKAISWRVVVFVVLGTISYLFTRSWEATTAITLVYNVLQILIYFGHERLWERIRWGRPNSFDTILRPRTLSWRP